ncbi:MAG TPA: class I SAM-dependent methyltransferase [Candidatus Acidoferrales bacterium]|nr:class I SAM-dependent methyltransferase [Candidatus Acidoferrales bacterium]
MPNSKKAESPTGTLFDQISGYWTEIADAHDTDKQIKFVKDHSPANCLTLDLNCGSGRHAIRLSEENRIVVGLDISSRLLKIAKDRAIAGKSNLWLVRADMRFLPFRSGIFDVALSLDSSFGYLPSEDDDTVSLSEIARTLALSGVFLLDVFRGEYMLSQHRRRFVLRDVFFGLARFPQFSKLFHWREYPSFYMLQKRFVMVKEKRLFDTWVFRDKRKSKVIVVHHVVRLYTLSKLESLLNKGRLKVTKTYGSYEGNEIDLNSRRLIVIAVKA